VTVYELITELTGYAPDLKVEILLPGDNRMDISAVQSYYRDHSLPVIQVDASVNDVRDLYKDGGN
jgi:hypothetical protein